MDECLNANQDAEGSNPSGAQITNPRTRKSKQKRGGEFNCAEERMIRRAGSHLGGDRVAGADNSWAHYNENSLLGSISDLKVGVLRSSLKLASFRDRKFRPEERGFKPDEISDKMVRPQ
jgi:hypothetical protein